MFLDHQDDFSFRSILFVSIRHTNLTTSGVDDEWRKASFAE